MAAALEGGATVRHNFGVPLLPLQRRSATAISLGAAHVGAPFQAGAERRYNKPQENIACPVPGLRNGTRRSALHLSFCTSRRVETNSALQKPSALTWHAQLNCQRTFRPKVTSGPHTGVQPGTKASAITCTACQSRLSSTLKADCPAVQLTNLGYVAADVKGEDFENLNPH